MADDIDEVLNLTPDILCIHKRRDGTCGQCQDLRNWWLEEQRQRRMDAGEIDG